MGEAVMGEAVMGEAVMGEAVMGEAVMGEGVPDMAAAVDAAQAAAVRWSALVLREDASFEALAEEWEDLYRRSAAATPFQSFGWLESWWREYGVAGRLRLGLVRRDGRLVAAAPLMLRRRGPFRVLVPLGAEQSDFHDLLVDDSCRDEACRALVAALRAEPGWQVIDLPEVPPGAAAQQLRAVWSGHCWQAPGSACLEIAAGSMAELLARLPRSAARPVQRKLRRIDRLGVQVREVAAPDVEEAVGALLRLHQEQWRGRAIDPEHLRPRFHRHLARAAGAMAERGQASVVEFRVAGRLVACDLDVVGPGFVGPYLAGFQPELRQQIDVAEMLMAQTLRLTERLGKPLLHLMRGTEPFKMRWQPTPVRNQRLLLARGGRRVVPLGYALAVRARTGLADALRHRAPWLRRARSRLRLASARFRGSDG
jgi:CelD/BcsL family acetyltransferase involved in cellulose biosynthesis